MRCRDRMERGRDAGGDAATVTAAAIGAARFVYSRLNALVITVNSTTDEGMYAYARRYIYVRARITRGLFQSNYM